MVRRLVFLIIAELLKNTEQNICIHSIKNSSSSSTYILIKLQIIIGKYPIMVRFALN